MIRQIRIKIASVLFPVLFRPDIATPMVKLGTPYGGWWVPQGVIDSSSICYLAGVGTDISFDTALIEGTGCRAWGFDPTPQSITWFKKTFGTLKRYELVETGLAGTSTSMRFYSPSDPHHISHSIKNLQHTNTFFTADVRTVKDTMLHLGHEHLDLLKLDIEGAEHDTIRTMLRDDIKPTVLAVEFDQPEPFRWAVNTVRLLRQAGYQLLKVDQFNFTFLLAEH